MLAITILQGFKEHVEKHHNMWAYIYYSLYLDQVDTSDQNAIEKYIHGKVSSKGRILL
jgi:inositol 1,4,5-triphosphate receptor type 1